MSATTELLAHQEREHPRHIPPSVRAAVLERDEYCCQAGGPRCLGGGENRLQLHHIEYRSQGGTHTQDNLVTLCWKCHEDVHANRLDVALIEVAPGTYAAFPNVPLKNGRAGR